VWRLSLGEGSKRGRGMESPSGSTGPLSAKGPAGIRPAHVLSAGCDREEPYHGLEMENDHRTL